MSTSFSGGQGPGGNRPNGDGQDPPEYTYAAMAKTAPLSPTVQSHLSRVYTWLAFATGSASLGSYLYVAQYIQLPQLLAHLITLVSVLAVSGTPYQPNNQQSQLIRRGALLSAAFTQGNAIGFIVETALDVNPTIVTVALLATFAIFACFTLSALFNRSRAGLYLGGFLGSALSVLSLSSLAGLFWSGSQALFSFNLYIGLLVFSLFIVYDTQKLLYQTELGYFDDIGQALELFTDVFAVFTRILVIFLRQEDSQEDRRRNRRKRNN
ncbi:Inhibitor of apoptosis-promoting Bax1-related protein [Tieghemiomyces parasiticus]|uniref:Inhibitor of apoptosis-promoting Bax1-related protein n=1 Tax=Tieghemiomyces parasiticus TaxID=78921 RepID=A0A9W8A6T2_9FUNG|nr:Inhibitor of apoptosis-promoting Bax1-related protein [Tieghemiomyces parasiticus]